MNNPIQRNEAPVHRESDFNSSIGRELITANEFAELLSVSERTLYRLKSIGQLPAPIVLGGSVRWRLSEIRDWVAKGCPAPIQN